VSGWLWLETGADLEEEGSARSLVRPLVRPLARSLVISSLWVMFMVVLEVEGGEVGGAYMSSIRRQSYLSIVSSKLLLLFCGGWRGTRVHVGESDRGCLLEGLGMIS